MYEVNTNSGVTNQMDVLQKTLSMLVNTMTIQNISLVQQAAQLQVCAICSHFDHTTQTCHLYSSADQEQANYVGQNNYRPKNNSYSNTYNPGWRNHPISHGVTIRML
jgi:hypothetical protein